DVRHHQKRRPVAGGGRAFRHAVVKLDVTPVLVVQLAGVVEAVSEKRRLVALQLVPFLACHLARLAPDADAGVGEESVGLAGFDLHVQNPIRLGVIFVKPRSRAYRSRGRADSSSTSGTACASAAASMLSR